MAKITEDMKKLIAKNQCFIATADKGGIPNVAPKGSTAVVDDQTIAFAEIVGKKTYNNILENPKVAVIVSDSDVMVGYKFIGNAELLTGGPLYDMFAERLHRLRLPDPLAVIRINVEEIYDMSIKNPGGRIA